MKILKFAILTLGLISSLQVISDEFSYRYPLKGISSQVPPAPPGASDIDCGSNHCYAIVNNELWVVGNNLYGQLGLGDTTARVAWTATGITDVKSVSAGHYLGYIVVGPDNKVYSAGNGRSGQLGRSSNYRNWDFAGISGVSDIEASGYFGYAVKDSTVYGVGYNYYGQLGPLVDVESKTYTWVDTGLDNPSDLDVGNDFGVALVGNDVYVIGSNNDGQLGVSNLCYGSRDCYSSEWVKSSVGSAIDVEAGTYNTYARMAADNDIYSVGMNLNNSLGRDDVCRSCKTNTWGSSGLKTASKISSRGHHIYALVGDQIWALGRDQKGQIPNSGEAQDWVNTLFTGAEDVFAGGSHGIIKTTDGKLFGAGANYYGIEGYTSGEVNQNWVEIIEPFRKDN